MIAGVVVVGDVAGCKHADCPRERASIPGIVVVVIGDDDVFPRRRWRGGDGIVSEK